MYVLPLWTHVIVLCEHVCQLMSEFVSSPLAASQRGEFPFLFLTSTCAPSLRMRSTNLDRDISTHLPLTSHKSQIYIHYVLYTVCVANSIAETHFQILRPAISVRKCHACWMQGCNEDHCISLLSLSPSLSLSFLSLNSFLLPFFLFSPHPFFPLSLSLSLFSSLTRSSPSLPPSHL